jgi:hypothetical protein
MRKSESGLLLRLRPKPSLGGGILGEPTNEKAVRTAAAIWDAEQLSQPEQLMETLQQQTRLQVKMNFFMQAG